ncbi:hypothetical protein FQP87_22280 [Vibrio tasmaniensis]|nr:hypothetical protein FQP87_22280 [Vibrio tasmaniensis]
MKLFLVFAILIIYMLFVPDYFAESTARIYQLEEFEVRILKFSAMLSGVISFVAFTPIEWFRGARWLK